MTGIHHCDQLYENVTVCACAEYIKVARETSPGVSKGSLWVWVLSQVNEVQISVVSITYVHELVLCLKAGQDRESSVEGSAELG